MWSALRNINKPWNMFLTFIQKFFLPKNIASDTFKSIPNMGDLLFLLVFFISGFAQKRIKLLLLTAMSCIFPWFSTLNCYCKYRTDLFNQYLHPFQFPVNTGSVQRGFAFLIELRNQKILCAKHSQKGVARHTVVGNDLFIENISQIPTNCILVYTSQPPWTRWSISPLPWSAWCSICEIDRVEQQGWRQAFCQIPLLLRCLLHTSRNFDKLNNLSSKRIFFLFFHWATDFNWRMYWVP